MNRYLTTLINAAPCSDTGKRAAIRRAAAAVAVNSHLTHYVTVGEQWTPEDVENVRRQAHELLGGPAFGPAPKVYAN